MRSAEYLVRVDFLDPFPILPGKQLPDETGAQNFVVGLSFVVMPAIGFLLVLLTGFAFHASVALLVLPGISAVAAFLLARLTAVRSAWAMVVALGSAVFCFVADSGALIVHGLFSVLHGMG